MVKRKRKERLSLLCLLHFRKRIICPRREMGIEVVIEGNQEGIIIVASTGWVS
jgi:hypothetical protein